MTEGRVYVLVDKHTNNLKVPLTMIQKNKAY